MNKIMIAIAVVIMILLIHSGLILRSQTMDIMKQKNKTVSENSALSEELGQKQKIKKKGPKSISHAFSLFINVTKMFETYSGTQMNIVWANTKENENIEEHYVDTSFRGVKALPMTISVEKFSNETDMAEVLNDVYLLEKRTDFKVSGISTENNSLIVKGELYGI